MEDNLTTLYGGAEAVPPTYPQPGMQAVIQQKKDEDRAEATPLMDVVSVSVGLDDTGINSYEALRLGNIEPVEGYEPPEDLIDQMEKRGIPAFHLDDLLDTESPDELEQRMRLYESRAQERAWVQSMGGKGTLASFIAMAADLPGLALDGAATAVGGAGLLSRSKRMAAAAGAFGTVGVVRGAMSNQIDGDYTPGQAFVDFAANAAFGAVFQGVGDWMHPAERIALANKLAAQADATNPATIARKAAEAQAALIPTTRPLTAADRKVREMAMRSEEAIRGGPRTPGINPPDPSLAPQVPSAAVPGATAAENARAIAIQQERLIRNRITPEKAQEAITAELGRLGTLASTVKDAAAVTRLKDEYDNLTWMVKEQKRNLESGVGELLDVELNKLVTERNDLIGVLAERNNVDVLSDGVAPLSATEATWIENRLQELAKLVPERAREVTIMMEARQATIRAQMQAHTAGQAYGYQLRDFSARYMRARKEGPTALLELAESLTPRKPAQRPGVDLDSLPKPPEPPPPAAPDPQLAVKQAEEAAALKASEDFADAEVAAAAMKAREPALENVAKTATQKMREAVSQAVAQSRKSVDEAIAKAKAKFAEVTDGKIADIVAKTNKGIDVTVEGLKKAAAALTDPKIRAINVELDKAIKVAMAPSKDQVRGAYNKAVKEAEEVAKTAKAKAAEVAKKAIADGADKDAAKAARATAYAKIDATLAAAKEAAKEAKATAVSPESAAAVAALKAAAEEKIAEINAAASKAVSAKKSAAIKAANEASVIAIGKVRAASQEQERKALQKIKAEAKQAANTEFVKAKRTAELLMAETVAASQRKAAERVQAVVEKARGARAAAREASAKAAQASAPAPTPTAQATAQAATGQPTPARPDDSAGAMRTEKFPLDGTADYDQSLTVGGDLAKSLEELADATADIETRTPGMKGIGYIAGIVRGAKDAAVRALGRIYTGDAVMAVKNGKEVLNEPALSDLASINYNTIWRQYRRDTEEVMRGYFTGFKGGFKRMLSASARQEFQAKVTRAMRGHHEENMYVLQAAKVARKALDDALALQKKYGVQGADLVEAAENYVPRTRKRDFVESIGQQVKYSYQGSGDHKFIVTELLKKAINLGFTRAGKDERFRQAVTDKVAGAMADRMFYESPSPNLFEATKFDLDYLDDVLKKSGVSLEDRNTISNVFNEKDPLNRSDAKASDHLKHRVLMDETASIQLDDGTVFSISDLFEDDMEALVNDYVRQAAGLAAFAEKGFDNPKKAWAIIEDLKSKGRMTDDEYKSFEIMHKSFLGMPLESDPGGRYARTLRTLGNFNFATMMGQVAWSQLAENGAIIAEAGWGAVMKQIPEMAEMFKQARTGNLDSTLAREMAVLGEPGASGIANPISMRAQDYDVIGVAGKVEQFSRAFARTTAYVSGMTPMTDFQQIAASRMFMQKMFGISKTSDAIPEAWMNRLKQYGMDTDDVTAMRAHLTAHAKDRNGVLTEVGLFKMDPDLQRKLQVMMHRMVRRVVQEADIGATMPWIHNTTARALTQFRGFGLTALAKRTLHSVYRHDATAGLAFVYGVGFAAMGLAGRTATTHPSDSKHYQNVFSNPARFAALAFAATGEASVFPMLWDTTAAALGHDYKFGNASRSTGNASTVLEGIPSVATLNNAWTAVKLLPKLASGGTATAEDYKATIGMLMGQTTHGLAMFHRVMAGKFPTQWEVDQAENQYP